MSFDEKTIFVKPDIFKSCKTLTQTDLTKIVNAFNDTLISKETLENIGLNIFQLTFGELENIKNENRALMVSIVQVTNNKATIISGIISNKKDCNWYI